MSGEDRSTYPFSAIVGQDPLKTALLINAVEPRVGGVLIRGQKGTAKSTAVRGLRSILPEIEVVDDCRFGCHPRLVDLQCDECRERRKEGALPVAHRRPLLVDLPVSATEDRVVGTIDLEQALKHGERRFEPGLLAYANRGILYVDEVNLLDDHLVDTLLDSAAMGVNVVEREGVRYQHPARFVLVGTMNPEEGEIRPQLLDRFGLCVDIEGIAEPAERVEILKRRRAFEDDPAGFARTWSPAQKALEERIRSAIQTIPDVELDDDLLFLIASVCAAIGVDGHRADLVMGRAAVAYAVLDGRREVTAADVRAVAPMVLAHRMRKNPFEEHGFDEKRLQELLLSAPGNAGCAETSDEPGADQSDGHGALVEVTRESGAPEAIREERVSAELVAGMDSVRRSHGGRRQETTTDDRSGRYVRAEVARPGRPVDLALDATIRAAAPYQAGRESDMAVAIEPQDLRSKVRKRRVGASIVFCVDASGSMGATNRMEAAKAAVLDLLVDAYQRRDRVGLVAFRGESAQVVLQPTASVELAQLKLRTLPTGGATPIAHGILTSLDVLAAEIRRDDSIVPWLVLLTDGRANVGIGAGLGSDDARQAAARLKDTPIHTLVIDTSGPGSGLGARELARVAGGEYVRLGQPEGDAVAGAVRQRMTA
ncbi:magnesium chelatase subunit D family protein [Anaerosoma tenue]|uniref:magnesium chelatase subunit D family protein n=1 Tax=Anaerosoma tenue TaxID=2933588 RepID=UPI0022609F9A|nr:magnesium chelatase subunit D family protein [Anaerosoma tenue]MCK8114152.1 magnesium chelatase subunit D family protein [Anaerosoma tenue]